MLTETPPKVNINVFTEIRSVLTENQHAALIDLKDKASCIQWEAGDLVNDIYIQVMANSRQASIMDVCCFVSDELYNLFAPQTLRIYSSLAKFYPGHVRAKYDLAPFWLFRYAIKFGDDWQDVFTWATEFCDLHARMPYEREVKAKFEPEKVQSPSVITSYNTISLPPEIEAIEQVAVSRECRSTLKVLISSLISLVPMTITELRNPEASRLLAQIAAMSKQLLEQYL